LTRWLRYGIRGQGRSAHAALHRRNRTNRVTVVSLNRKRRIFRSGLASALPSLGRGLAGALPSPGLLVAAAGGLAMIGAVVWLFMRPSDAPALVPEVQHVSAPANRLAVIDGGTLRVGDDIIHLSGIIAPARDTRCRTATGAEQDCGVAAANALAALVRQRQVDCAIHGHDALGRAEADCQAGGVSLNEAQVREGWARAQTGPLRETEAAAKAAGRGVWRNGDGS
jgi:endonuclease YncB( thermonuclease family)